MKRFSSLLLTLVCFFSCPVMADCGQQDQCCGQDCCNADLSADHCQAPVSQLLPDLPEITPAIIVNCPTDPAAAPELVAFQALPSVPNLTLFIEQRLNPHTGPPQLCVASQVI